MTTKPSERHANLDRKILWVDAHPYWATGITLWIVLFTAVAVLGLHLLR